MDFLILKETGMNTANNNRSLDNLSRIVHEKEQEMSKHRLEMAHLLDRDEWLGDKENYVAYNDPIWWMGHEQASFALVEIWKDALDNKDTYIRSFGGNDLTEVYSKTKILSLESEAFDNAKLISLKSESLWQRIKFIFTGKV